jgi:hypothetical protein
MEVGFWPGNPGFGRPLLLYCSGPRQAAGARSSVRVPHDWLQMLQCTLSDLRHKLVRTPQQVRWRARHPVIHALELDYNVIHPLEWMNQLGPPVLPAEAQ